MENKNLYVLYGLVALTSSFVVGYLFLEDRAVLDNGGTVVETDLNEYLGEDLVLPVEEGTGEENSVVATPLPKAPDLDRPITFTEEFLPEYKMKVVAQMEEIITWLKQDTNLFNQWMDLGVFRKAIGDHEGARDVWEYAGAIRPQNSLSFMNLGLLYGYYLNNPISAEENFLKSLENNDKDINSYYYIVDFYLEVMKDKDRALAILKRGAEVMPKEDYFKQKIQELQ